MTKLEIIKALQEVRKVATMERSSFHIGDKPFPFGAECTDLVRVATKLWRESWIIEPLDRIIAELKDDSDTLSPP